MKNQKLNHDRITNLPDPVLSSIISRLPLRDAVATSLLSRQWRHIWRSLSNIDADPLLIMNVDKNAYEKVLEREKNISYEFRLNDYDDLFENEISDSIRVIDDVLSRQEQDITSCRIVHYSNHKLFSDRMIYWINLLKERELIRELSLSYRYLRDPRNNLENQNIAGINVVFAKNNLDAFGFPVSMFQCKTLRKLELRKYDIKSASPFQGCENLETLVLDSMKIRDEILAKILSDCTSLQDLTLKSCRLSNFRIQNNGLKRLEIQNFSVGKFHVSMESLIVLVIHNLKCGYDKLAIDCPNIRVLRASWEPKQGKYNIHDKVLDQCSGHWDIPRWAHPLLRKPYQEPCENLRELCISFDMNTIKLKVLLHYIFITSIHLHTLGITNQVTPSKDDKPWHQTLDISWEKMEVFDSVSEQLRTVWIKGFTGKNLEINFVSYLIKNASKLNNLIIQCDDKCSKGGAIKTMGLLFLPKASLSARITLEPSPSFLAKNNKPDFNAWLDTLE